MSALSPSAESILFLSLSLTLSPSISLIKAAMWRLLVVLASDDQISECVSKAKYALKDKQLFSGGWHNRIRCVMSFCLFLLFSFSLLIPVLVSAQTAQEISSVQIISSFRWNDRLASRFHGKTYFSALIYGFKAAPFRSFKVNGHLTVLESQMD